MGSLILDQFCLSFSDANSTEFNPESTHPVVGYPLLFLSLCILNFFPRLLSFASWSLPHDGKCPLQDVSPDCLLTHNIGALRQKAHIEGKLALARMQALERDL